MLILNNHQPVLELTPVADASCPARVGVPVPVGRLSPWLPLHGERGKKWGVPLSSESQTSKHLFLQGHMLMAISTSN